MKLLMFSVVDAKAKAFIAPFTLPTEAMAVREFADCANDPTHKFSKHPEDYTLYRVGTFDSDTGEVQGELALVCHAVMVKKEGVA